MMMYAITPTDYSTIKPEKMALNTHGSETVSNAQGTNGKPLCDVVANGNPGPLFLPDPTASGARGTQAQCGVGPVVLDVRVCDFEELSGEVLDVSGVRVCRLIVERVYRREGVYKHCLVDGRV